MVLQWGRNFIVAERRRQYKRLDNRHGASMGPQLYRCGKGVGIPISHAWLSMLQWGRNFIVAERRVPPAARPCLFPASMGPQLYRCGKACSTCSPPMYFSCFNGAATLSLRKDGNILNAIKRIQVLQWGRNFIVAEIPNHFNPCGNAETLQWGRNFIVAEIQQKKIKEFVRTMASMGPQLYRCGNRIVNPMMYGILIELQWGRNFIVAEMLAICQSLT